MLKGSILNTQSLLKPRSILYLLVGMSMAWYGLRWMNQRTQPAGLSGSLSTELADCPDRPNCVSSTAERDLNHIAPIAMTGTVAESQARLKEIIAELPRSRIVESSDRYLRAEFRSRLLGFVDDLELLLDEEQKLIFVRSASRTGYSDFGVNRQRVETIRRRYDSQAPESPTVN